MCDCSLTWGLVMCCNVVWCDVMWVVVHRACEFLVSKQNADGGWGESYLSCVTRKYSVNKQEGSQVVNTAWSLLTLMAGNCKNREAVQRCVCLVAAWM